MACDNCVRRMIDKPIYVDIKPDVQKMLEVIDAITKIKQQVTRNDVIDVFRQSQAKDIKNQFGHLPVYQEKFPRILKTKDVFLLLDDLVLRKLVHIVYYLRGKNRFTIQVFTLICTKNFIQIWPKSSQNKKTNEYN
jgi:hypothetical protein